MLLLEQRWEVAVVIFVNVVVYLCQIPACYAGGKDADDEDYQWFPVHLKPIHLNSPLRLNGLLESVAPSAGNGFVTISAFSLAVR